MYVIRIDEAWYCALIENVIVKTKFKENALYL